METEKTPFEAVRAMMLENLERVGLATQTYIDMVERTMRNVPGANQEQIRTFMEYTERQVAANRDFCEKLLRAKDFQGRIPHSGRVLSVPVVARRCRIHWEGFLGCRYPPSPREMTHGCEPTGKRPVVIAAATVRRHCNKSYGPRKGIRRRKRLRADPTCAIL